jgi:hypothetical protein
VPAIKDDSTFAHGTGISEYYDSRGGSFCRLRFRTFLTPEHLAASGASREDVSALLDELASVGKRVELMIRTRPMLPDPNDEMVLETAINGRADAIVTFNDRDFRPVAVRFRCSVVRPGEVIRGLAEETE